MKNHRTVLALVFILSVIFNGTISSQNSSQKSTNMVRHTVVFKLKYQKNSPEEKEFINAIMKLQVIPGVKKFEFLKQISKKNKYDYGLSMEFDSQKAYDEYSNHPDHNAFVQKYWVTQVEDFMELDFEAFK